MATTKRDQLRGTHRAHYELEVQLADRLRSAPASTRGRVYSEVYDELFRSVPDHPQLQIDAAERRRSVLAGLRFVRRFAGANSRLLEIGAGDCEFALAAAGSMQRVVGIDVSEEIVSQAGLRDNLDVYVTDGITIPLETATIDVVFSDQLMEHLHPDDAISQLREIRRVLKVGGDYVCITPNRTCGPHDVSGLFGDVARGFHLREYDSRELAVVFGNAGFERIRYYVGGRGFYVRIPSFIQHLLEDGFTKLPRAIRARVRTSLPVTLLLGLTIVAS